MIQKYSRKKYLIFGVISLGMGSLQSFGAHTDTPRAQTESEQLAKQEQEMVVLAPNTTAPEAKQAESLVGLEQGAEVMSPKYGAKMALVLNIQKNVTANTALKQSILDHDKKIAELELALNKKQQTWFDWAASFFKTEEPKKPRALGQFKTELAAATAAYVVSKGNPKKFDSQFLRMAWKKQKLYELELKKIIVQQKQEIDRLQAQL